MQAGKSFVLDEIDFPLVAHATSQTLKPVYYRGEATPFHVGTYHPTLYINSLALFIKIFGFNEISVRLFGVACTLISAYLLVLILRQLIDRNETAEALFLGLYLLNPYTIANTTLPDIDSTVLPVLILVFIYFAIRYLHQKKDMGNRVVWILSCLFGLALWSKLTTPLIIPPFLAVLAIITSRDYWKSLAVTLKVTAIGSLAFFITYFAYCKVLRLSATYTYHFLFASFAKGTSSGGRLTGVLNNLQNIKGFVFWPTVPVITLFAIAFMGIMLDTEKNEGTKIKKLLVLTSLLVTIFYTALIAPFGGFFKYPFPVFGIFILTIALFYDRYFKERKVSAVYALAATLLGFLLERAYWKDSMFYLNARFESLAVLLLIVVICFVFLRTYTHRVLASLLILYIFFCIGFQLSISRIQATSHYSTKYLYGQTGLDQTAAYLRTNTDPQEVIWSMKDVGYYTNNRYYESYPYYFDKSLEGDLVSKLQEGKVRYYVATTGIGEDNIDYYPEIGRILDTYAIKEKQFGNFVVYKSKAVN